VRYTRFGNDRGGSPAVPGNQAWDVSDFAGVARFCFIGLGLSYTVIAGAPEFVLAIASAFASFCGVPPAT